MLVSPNGSPVVGVRIRADRGDACPKQLLAMGTYKGTTVAAAEQVRFPDVLVYAA
jgi:Fe2+ transport system protein FeoA